MSDTASLEVEARDLIRRGLPIVICDGKVPLGGDSWHTKPVTEANLSGLLRQASCPAIGLKMGDYIDIEADGPDEEALVWKLFDGCEIPITPTYKSTRGKHRVFNGDDRFRGTNRAVVNFSNGNGAKLGIRIGADGKAAQSIIPPSAGREWLVSWDEVEPATLPDVVVQRILAAARPEKRQQNDAITKDSSGEVHSRALAGMLRHRPDGGESDGSKRLYAVCCRGVEHDLGDIAIVATVREYAEQYPFPRNWTDGEIIARIRDAEKQATRGSEVVIANCTAVEVEGDDGEMKTISVPMSMTDIIDLINKRMANWPRRVDNMLFVDDPAHGLDYFDRRTTAGLFGWLRRHNKVQWGTGGSLVSQSELFAEIERTTQRYDAIEVLPHEPPISGIYYRGKAPSPGDGKYLRQLVDRFRPATTVDRDLIQAAFMTPLWGGLPGSRPAFVITSDDGRGVGKTKVAETISHLCGGHLDVSAGEDIETLKTRALAPAARTKRIALIDNIKSMRLSWAELEALITSPVISGRQLYVGEGQRPNVLTWFLTLNGVSMATDMAQRSVIIKIVRGENAGVWWEETRQFVDDHRNEIIGDIIGALRSDPFPLAKFSRWATWEKDVLCRLPEPGDAQRLILERQGEADCELDEAEIIEQHFGEQLRKLEYDPQTAQVRIQVAVAARWYSWAVGEPTKTANVTRKLKQMADEGHLKRLAPEPGRSHGRCFIWTGAAADVFQGQISNDLQSRLGHMMADR